MPHPSIKLPFIKPTDYSAHDNVHTAEVYAQNNTLHDAYQWFEKLFEG